MGFAWTTAVKDWRRHRRDPLGLFMWIGIPIIVGALMSMVVGGRNGPAPQAHVLVADADASFVSGLFVGALSQDAMGGLVRTESVDLEAGRSRIDDGDATALLVIPEGFGDAILTETPTTLELVTNPAQAILPGIVEELLSVLADATFYLHRVLGRRIGEIVAGSSTGAGPFSDSRVSEISVDINQTMQRLGPYVFPPVIEIEPVVDEGESDRPVNVALYFLPGLLFMSLLFIAQGVSADLWRERDKRTLRRVVVSPQSAGMFLAGKLVAAAGIIGVVATVSMAAGFAYFGLHVAMLPFAVIWTIVSGLFLVALMNTIQVFSPTERAGGVLTMALLFPLMMVGGSFFPFEAMGDTMAAIGRLTPNGWALEQLKSILFDRVEPAALAATAAGLFAVGGALFFLTVRRVRTRFVQE